MHSGFVVALVTVHMIVKFVPMVTVFMFFCYQGNCVSVLMGILRQMTETHYRQYIQEFPYSIDLRDFLMEILMLFQVLVSNPVYPSDWMDMIMLQNR